MPASDGFNVSLTIDATIQRMAEDELAAIAAQYEPEKATIIVSDPQTGFILALANYPSFDLNRFNKLCRARTRQGCATSPSPTSTSPARCSRSSPWPAPSTRASSRPRRSSTARSRRSTTRASREACPGRTEWDRFDHPLTVAEIVAKSSNKGAAQLAMTLGDRRFYDYARAFGFGQQTGFPVGGEVTGKLKPPEKWDSLTITRMPMGQSVTATALQMQQAMGVIASGGLLLKPQIISQVRDAQGELVYTFGRVEVRRVVSEQTARTMARLLTAVVSPEGNAPEAAIPGFEVAGKTGTANKLIPFELGLRRHGAALFRPAPRGVVHRVSSRRPSAKGATVRWRSR